MATNLEGVHSIVQAYLSGHQVGKSKKDEATRQKERAESIKLEQERFDTLQKQLKERQSVEDARQKALDALTKAQVDARMTQDKYDFSEALRKGYESGSGIPEGYKPTGNVSSSVQVEPGYATTRQEFGSENANQPSFNALEPEDAARRQLQLQREALAPKQEAELEQIKIKALIDSVEKDKQFQNQLQIARERTKATLDAAKIRAQATGVDKNLSNLAQMALKNPDIINDPKLMNPTQRAKVLNELGGLGVNFATASQETALEHIDTALQKIQQIRNNKASTGFIASQKAKISGTEDFANALDIQQLKAILTMPELQNLRGLGTMSDREFNALTSAATTLDIGLPDDRFVNTINEAETLLTNAKSKLLSRTSGKSTSTNSSNSSKPVIKLKADANGNIIQ